MDHSVRLAVLRWSAVLAVVLLLAAGCTLGTSSEPPTLTPLPTLHFLVTATAYTTQQPAVTLAATPIAGVAQAADTVQPPATIVGPVATIEIPVNPGADERSKDFITALLERAIIPVFNFLFTLVSSTVVSLWNAAGLQGGFVAQTLCCVIPGIIAMIWLMRYLFRRTWFPRFRRS